MTRPDPVRLAEISTEPLDVARIYDLVQEPSSGGVAVFVGTVRDHDGGRTVTALEYSSHPTAESAARTIVGEAAGMAGVRAVAAAHRVGALAIGDVAVVVGVACGHRGDAFRACQWTIDELKSRLPIWKHQWFADGTDEWVGSP